MISNDEFSKLTSLIYQASIDQSRWIDFLDTMHQRFSGAKMQLYGYDAGAKIALGHLLTGYDEEYLNSLFQYYGDKNVWAQQHLRMQVGKVYNTDALYDRKKLIETEIYNDWLKPQEDLAIGEGVVLFRDQTRAFGFGANVRAKDHDRIGQELNHVMQMLTPHLQQSFEIARVLARQSYELDLLHQEELAGKDALLLLTETGQILYANNVAETLLEQGEIFGVDVNGRLCFSNLAASACLNRCLRSLQSKKSVVSSAFTLQGKALPPVCLKPTETIVRAVKVDAEALRDLPYALLMGATSPCLQVSISLPKRNIDAVAEFAHMHGLTAAELAVAEAVADGKTLSEVADLRKVSVHTVRYQVKSAMSKMDVRRQVEMVRIIETVRNSR